MKRVDATQGKAKGGTVPRITTRIRKGHPPRIQAVAA